MEITVFSAGDSKDINFWSNAPYFFTKGIEECGYKVNRVNVGSRYGIERYVEALYNRTIMPVIKKIKTDTSFSYSRSRVRLFFLKLKLRRGIKQYKNTDLFISLSFSFPVYMFERKKTIVNVCDWTYEFEIKHNKNKDVDCFEKNTVKLERDILQNTRWNVVWRDECRLELLEKYDNIIRDDGLETINLNYPIPDSKGIIENKIMSRSVVFIGASRYLEGAKVFVKTINKLNDDGFSIDGSVIGVNEEELCIKNNHSTHLKYFGYLNKGNEKENEIYYKIILSSRVIVNTNPGFVSAAAIKEGCYLYTPIIVSKSIQTETSFGDITEIGYECQNEVDELYNTLKKVFSLTDNEYKSKCIASHNRFKDASWKEYVSYIMNYVKEREVI